MRLEVQTFQVSFLFQDCLGPFWIPFIFKWITELHYKLPGEKISSWDFNRSCIETADQLGDCCHFNNNESVFCEYGSLFTYLCVLSCFSHVWLFLTPWNLTLQAPLSMGFPRQEYWSGLPCPPPGYLHHPGSEAASPVIPAVLVDSLLLSHWGTLFSISIMFYSFQCI